MLAKAEDICGDACDFPVGGDVFEQPETTPVLGAVKAGEPATGTGETVVKALI